MIETDVLRAIIGAAVEAIGQRYPIQAPGRKFTPPNGGKFIELVVIQDNNGNETWGDEKLFTGDIRVILHWPMDDAGIYAPIEELGTVAASLFKGRQIWHGQAKLLLSDNPRIIDAIEGDGDMLYPLIVPYSCFHVPD